MNTFERGNYNIWFRYKSMMYYALLMLGGNEIGPVNEIEMTFVFCNMIAAALLKALLFGDIAGLISALEKKNVALQETLDGAFFVMMKIGLEEEEQNQIRDFLLVTNYAKTKQDDLDVFFTTLSPSLIQKVQNYLYENTLNTNVVVAKIILKLDSQEKKQKKNWASYS